MSFKKLGTSVGIVFCSAFLTVYSASPTGVDVAKTAAAAGIIALLVFAKKIVQLYLNDDKLTNKEIDEALSTSLDKEDTL